MYFSKANIHFRRPRVESFAHVDNGLFKETYLCDLTTVSVVDHDRLYGNRPYASGDYLGVSTANDAHDYVSEDAYVFTKIDPWELQLDRGRFRNFDANCYDNRISIIVEVLNPLGDLIDFDHLTYFVNWFHERTKGTSDKWNLSIDFTRELDYPGLQVVLTFFTSSAELAILLRLEQSC